MWDIMLMAFFIVSPWAIMLFYSEDKPLTLMWVFYFVADNDFNIAWWESF